MKLPNNLHEIIDKQVFITSEISARNTKIMYYSEPLKWNSFSGLGFYRKAYDQAPHTWLMERFEALKITRNIQHLTRDSVKAWRVVQR